MVNSEAQVNYAPFTAAHPQFYDVLWSPDAFDDSAAVAPLAQDAPPGWRVRSQGPWTTFDNGAPVPATGWKVHVAALPSRAHAVARMAVSTCWALGVPVKALTTTRLVQVSQQKYASSSVSGKVVTAYPPDDAAATALVDALVEALAGEPAPRILGDVPLAAAPVSLRYGAFRQAWLVGADGESVAGRLECGEVVADARGPNGRATSPPLPAALQRYLRSGPVERLDITDVLVLHRSNAGGVYRATWSDGSTVVLKEARRHAGIDAGGRDAVARLRHERDVMMRLAGLGVVPEVVDHVALGDSEMLVMEYVAGQTLTAAMVARHPGSCPKAGASRAEYLDWVERTTDRLGRLAHILAAHGVAHGDIHPGNVVERRDALVLLDLESAALDGVAVATGVAVRGFSTGERPCLRGDLAAIELTRLTLLNPLAVVLPWRPDLTDVLEDTGRADVLGPSRAGLSPGPARPNLSRTACRKAGPDAAALIAGIRRTATPHRRDRHFPGDIAQFATPDGGLGLLHGAAGVCLTLAAIGAGVAPAWLDWICEQAGDGRHLTGGIAHGREGVALALALMGRPEAAAALAAKSLTDVPPPSAPAGRSVVRSVVRSVGPWWEHGHAGRAVALAELGALLARPDLTAAATWHARACLEALAVDDPPSHAPGLLRGWSGVALALTRVADLVEPADRDRYLAGAVRAVVREARHTRMEAGVLVAVDGHKLLPYLGVGSAALGLAADSLLERGVAGLTDARLTTAFSALVDGVVAAAQLPVVIGAGLMMGRAGLLATVRRLVGDDETAVALHTARLGWHEVPLPADGAQTLDPASAMTGEYHLRLSTDLATGSAGTLVALAPATTDLLHGVLRLPSRPVRQHRTVDTSPPVQAAVGR